MNAGIGVSNIELVPVPALAVKKSNYDQKDLC
jgi:hypothetical protein